MVEALAEEAEDQQKEYVAETIEFESPLDAAHVSKSCL